MNLKDYNEKYGSCYMLGIIPDGEKLCPIDTLSSNREIVIANIKMVSAELGVIENEINSKTDSQYYIAIDTEQKEIENDPGYRYKEISEKIEYWEEKLKNKIICFKPNFREDPNNPEKIIKNAIIEFTESYEGNISKDEYILIPTLDLDTKEFERKLIEGDTIDLKGYSHYMYQPEYIICGDYIYSNFTTWDMDSNLFTSWIHREGTDHIRKLKINMNDMEHIIVNDSLVFMDNKILRDMDDNKSLELIAMEDTKELEEAIESKTINDEEYKFLDDLKKETIKLGLSYGMDDLINLHTCVKTNPLTILSGMSGTGKSKLANIYSNVLHCTEENENLLFLPINPSYTEPGDLLGYLNNTTGIYMSSDTRLVDFLNNASEKKDKMHIVIFDEMNLSQVEYWFAPFISLLEREINGRYLYLYNPEANCINRKQYPPSIHIGENVRFIGTVNIDETTKDFSDRLLDRANIIILEKQPFKTLKNELLKFNEENKNIISDENEHEEKHIYSKWINRNKWLEAFDDKEIQFFDELHEIINKYDNQKGVSFRIVEKIGEFLNNIPMDEDYKSLLNRSKAFDLQVNQRIITKVKGTEQQFGRLIGIINNYGSDEISNGELSTFFLKEEWKEISDFTLTKKEINRKAKELGVYGYAN